METDRIRDAEAAAAKSRDALARAGAAPPSPGIDSPSCTEEQHGVLVRSGRRHAETARLTAAAPTAEEAGR